MINKDLYIIFSIYNIFIFLHNFWLFQSKNDVFLFDWLLKEKYWNLFIRTKWNKIFFDRSKITLNSDIFGMQEVAIISGSRCRARFPMISQVRTCRMLCSSLRWSSSLFKGNRKTGSIAIHIKLPMYIHILTQKTHTQSACKTQASSWPGRKGVADRDGWLDPDEDRTQKRF